jgi:AcrR family transcriptional regulator
MSKSGLFAHFKSKERLQLDVLQHAAQIFTDMVLKPSLKKPRGIPRIRALYENWNIWADNELPGGCLFIAASFEYDDRPGPVRDYLYDLQSKWIESLSLIANHAVNAGVFKSSTDCGQFAYELFSLMIGYHHFKRMLTSDRAKSMQDLAFENLISRHQQSEQPRS